MTTAEFYYLMLCISAFAVFGMALSYSTMSWNKWKRAQSDGADAVPQAALEKPKQKLAA
jgi:hypothetical protein